ncbi:MAG: rod shape-determining protein MreD [Chitinophagaceae bacterium]|nr:rod shape-determining protein MreD [Chitinophagaceae bacterium]MCA6452459.1 rod shape-determining protein MreD [Chitinophagaceae bacterium]MCA6456227.1 rod shape-determining protein MreD [Chitinophagaceae bacterium]MCA6458652.1 rod shape-determining protein MreD [Chitinophagaceae bacterium]MCA6466071.1 rod shape-determining protein MreD [Chitinophagaceae bacterium]
MSSLLKNIIRFVVFILFQVYILNQVPPLHQYLVPYLYFLFILWLPFNISRFWLLLISFVFGLCLDYFTGTYGLHAAPCVLIAYIRPFLLNLLIPQETMEQSYVEPGHKSMGWAPYALYAGILSFVHHFYLVLIEWLQFGNFVYFLGKVAGTTAISLLMIFLAELLFNRNSRYRATN